VFSTLTSSLVSFGAFGALLYMWR